MSDSWEKDVCGPQTTKGQGFGPWPLKWIRRYANLTRVHSMIPIRITAPLDCRRKVLILQAPMPPAMIRPPTMAKSAKLSTIPTAAKHLPKISGFFVEA